MRNLMIFIGLALVMNTLAPLSMAQDRRDTGGSWRAQYHQSLIKTMIKLESQNDKLGFNFNLIPEAFAFVSGGACMVAGWQGTYDGARHSCSTPECKSPENIAKQCGGKGSIVCNPAVFGDGVCISPQAGNYHWTLACEDQMLSSAGVKGKSVDSLSAEDLGKVETYLKDKKWNYLDATDPLATICANIQASKDKYVSDCNDVHGRLIALNDKIKSTKTVPPKADESTVKAETSTPLSTTPEEATTKVETATVRPVNSEITKKVAREQAKCGTVDLSKEFGPRMENGINKNSPAYAAVDLMNFKEPKRDWVSALSTVQLYKNQLSTHDNTDTAWMIKTSRDLGACKESDISSYKPESAEQAKAFELEEKNLSSPTCDAVAAESSITKIKELSKLLFKGLSSKQIDKIKQEDVKGHNEYYTSFLDEMISKSCQKKFSDLPKWAASPIFQMKTGKDTEVQSAFDLIHKNLDQRFPTAITFQTQGLTTSNKNAPGEHSAVIAGREYIVDANNPSKSGCYFSIKMNGQDQDVDQAEGLLAKRKLDKKGSPTTYVQVKDSDLARFLTQVTHIEPKK